jgi:thioredoxin 1
MNKIIKFSASWCGPCKAMAPSFQKFSEEYQNTVEIQDLDIDEDANFELARKYNIKSVPHTVFIKNGDVATRIYGVADYTKLAEIYKEVYQS